MGFSTTLFLNVKKADSDFLRVLEACLGVPIVVTDRGANKSYNSSTFKFGKDTCRYRCASATLNKLNVFLTFNLTYEKTDDGYTVSICYSIDEPYEGNEKYFEDFINFAKIYGYSSYEITSEFDENEISEVIEETQYPYVFNKRFSSNSKNKSILITLINCIAPTIDDDFCKANNKAVKTFNRETLKEAKRLKTSNITQENLGSIIAYCDYMYELKLSLMVKALNDEFKYVPNLKKELDKCGYEFYSDMYLEAIS